MSSDPTMNVVVGATVSPTATAAQLKDLMEALDFVCEQSMQDGVVTDYDCYSEPVPADLGATARGRPVHRRALGREDADVEAGRMAELSITDFINARLDELEDDARSAYYDGQAWVPEEEAVVAADRDLEPVLFLDRKRDARHAANWSPAYVLADIAAKRRILAEYRDALATLEGEWEMNSDSASAWQERVWALEPVVRLLAAPFSSHSQWQEEWRA